MISKFNWSRGYWLTSGVLLAGILLRFLYLDADPHYYEWVGYITDEGRWVQHARSLALHGTLFDHNLDIHFFLAPLFQLVNYLVFELAGVTLLTSRMFTAFCGSAILILFCGLLRHTMTPQALLLGLTLLAFQTDLVVLSRVAVPETVIMFFQLLIYFVIVSSRGSKWPMVLAGLFLLLAVGMKATIVLFLPIFSVVILFMPRNHFGVENGLQKWRHVMLFWAGFTLPIVVVGSVWYFFSSEQIAIFWNSLKDIFNLFGRFVRLPNLYIYNIISFPFEDTLSPTFNIWALGLWLSALAWMAGGWNNIDFESHRYLATSAIWFIFYLLLMLSLEYFPTRYKVHILIPMALFITVGISLMQRLGIRKVIESFAEAKGSSGLLWLGVISFPTAAFLSPLLASALILIGMDPDRVKIKLACFIFSLGVATFLVHRLKRSQQAVCFFLIFPLMEGIAWMIFSTLVNVHSFWPIVGSQFHFALLSLFILVGLAISAGFGWFASRSRIINCGCCVTAFALFYLTISLVRIAPGYINPHYSIRDTSRDLGTLLSSSSTIATINAEGLFNENNLRYKSFSKVNWPLEKPEILVIAFGFVRRKNILEQEYRLVKSYDLYVSPEYYHAGQSPVPRVSEGVMVTVYKKNGTGWQ